MTHASIMVHQADGLRVLLVANDQNSLTDAHLTPEIKFFFSRWQIPANFLGRLKISGQVVVQSGEITHEKIMVRGARWQRTDDLLDTIATTVLHDTRWMHLARYQVEHVVNRMTDEVMTSDNLARLNDELALNRLIHQEKQAAKMAQEMHV